LEIKKNPHGGMLKTVFQCEFSIRRSFRLIAPKQSLTCSVYKKANQPAIP